jgi:hypothetical protein
LCNYFLPPYKNFRFGRFERGAAASMRDGVRLPATLVGSMREPPRGFIADGLTADAERFGADCGRFTRDGAFGFAGADLRPS